MTREEAKDYIREWCPYDRQEEIIKALEQEPCEDCISRQAVLEGIAEWVADGYADSEADISHISSLVTHLPSVTPKERTGKWIFDEILDRHYYCSECKSMGVDYWDYCPECGARMIEPQESEDKE